MAAHYKWDRAEQFMISAMDRPSNLPDVGLSTTVVTPRTSYGKKSRISTASFYSSSVKKTLLQDAAEKKESNAIFALQHILVQQYIPLKKKHALIMHRFEALRK